MSPSPVPDHDHAGSEMWLQDHDQLPQHLEAIQDVDVDLRLSPSAAPGFVRRPDLIVAQRGSRQRIRREGGVIRAGEVLVVVELVSPDSRRTDKIIKRAEYADASIPTTGSSTSPIRPRCWPAISPESSGMPTGVP